MTGSIDTHSGGIGIFLRALLFINTHLSTSVRKNCPPFSAVVNLSRTNKRGCEGRGEKACRTGSWKERAGVMCGRLKIISTTRCCVAIMEIVARQQHPSVHFCALPCLNSKAVSLFLMVCNSHQLVWPGVGVPTSWLRLRGYTSSSSRVPILWCCSGGPAMGLLHMGQTQRTSSHFTKHLHRGTQTGQEWGKRKLD